MKDVDVVVESVIVVFLGVLVVINILVVVDNEKEYVDV